VLRRINERRAVFEVYLLCLCVLTGTASYMVPDARARSIVTSFPPWAQGLWYVGIALGGVLGLYGVAARQVDTALLVERVAMALLIGLTASYGAAAIAYQGLSAIPASMALIGFTGIAVVRMFQINQDLATLQARLELRREVPE